MAYNRDKIRKDYDLFVKQYARKKRNRIDPNDRRYDRKLENIIKNMNPEKLNEIINEDDEDSSKIGG